MTNAVSGGVTGERAVAWLDRAADILRGIDRPVRYPVAIVLWALTAGPAAPTTRCSSSRSGTIRGRALWSG